RERGLFLKMTTATRSLLRNKKAVIISMPALIGLLPSLGGAYFSAPMVDESTRDMKMSQEEKAFINYWFRHPWEFILPLYPGVLLAAALTGIELRSLILANCIYAALIFITGFSFSMRRQSIGYDGGGHLSGQQAGSSRNDALKQQLSFFPIIFILGMVMVLHVKLHYALGIVVASSLIFYRYRPKEILTAIKYGFTINVVTLIAGVMLFKFTMEQSGAVAQLSGYFSAKGIPMLPIIMLLPFISGLLTGLTVGFVGAVFPLIISLTGGAHLNEISAAFAAGFIGVLLSPVHLCLVLTREYFKADMWGIYKKTIPACGIIMAAAIAGYFIL
ncbi:MAG: DUF401 family protein, partial [Nitrospirae bacterium]|nr:DUF401 family protein [Nitrospirota bacterium]